MSLYMRGKANPNLDVILNEGLECSIIFIPRLQKLASNESF